MPGLRGEYVRHWGLCPGGRESILKPSITGRHIELTDALKERVEEKVERFEKFFDGITHAAAILTLADGRLAAEMTLTVRPGVTLVAVADSPDDMYMAVEAAADKLERQLKKHKEKLQDRRKHT